MTTDEFTLISGILDTMVCLRDGYVRALRCRSFLYDGRFNLGSTFMRTLLPYIFGRLLMLIEEAVAVTVAASLVEMDDEEGMEKMLRFGNECRVFR